MTTLNRFDSLFTRYLLEHKIIKQQKPGANLRKLAKIQTEQKSHLPSPISSGCDTSTTTSGDHDMSDQSSQESSPDSPEPVIKYINGLRVFECSVASCKKLFNRKEHVQRHIRIHTGAKPFPCSFPGCQKRFSRCDNRDTHALTHLHKAMKE